MKEGDSVQKQLWTHIRAKDIDGVKKAVADGADIHALENDLNPALAIATNSSFLNVEIVKFLLDKGANPNFKAIQCLNTIKNSFLKSMDDGYEYKGEELVEAKEVAKILAKPSIFDYIFGPMWAAGNDVTMGGGGIDGPSDEVMKSPCKLCGHCLICRCCCLEPLGIPTLFTYPPKDGGPVEAALYPGMKR